MGTSGSTDGYLCPGVGNGNRLGWVVPVANLTPTSTGLGGNVPGFQVRARRNKRRTRNQWS
jgi:hypothetical protein